MSPRRRAVRVAVAPLLAEPRPASIQTSQLLGGHFVDELAAHGDWLEVIGADGYTGWVHSGYLGDAVRDAAGPLRSGWMQDRPLSLGCTARTASGAHLRLPLGALLPEDATAETGEAVSQDERRARFAASAGAIVASADRFFPGTPYVWGGVTPWGADCSGFVQSLFALHGVLLPRDAWQQAEVGELIQERNSLRPGDLAFFCAPGEPRMTHVGVIVEPDLMIHLSVSRGGYAVEPLDSGDVIAGRLNASYRFSRRVLNG